MSRQCDVTPDGGADGFASEPATDSAFFIGKIETVVGSCTLTQSGGSPVQIKPGDPVCEGDTIQTAAGGKVCIRFIDGTVFNLSDSARMVLREFAGDVASPSAQFDVSNGTFAFIAGEMAKTGRLNIDTPFASIRGRSRAGGIGTLSLASLFFAAMEEVHAKTPALSFLDDGVINFKESEDYKDAIRDGKFGTVELTVKAAQPYTTYLNDPGDTIVLRQIGSSVSESHVPNSLVQMLGFANDQQQVLQVAAQGQGPTGFGNGGSSTPPPLPPELAPQPINTFVPQPPPFLPPNGGTGGSTTTALDFVPQEQPLPPLPPLVNPDGTTAPSGTGNVLQNDTGGPLTVISVQDALQGPLPVNADTTSANGTEILGLYGTLRIGADGSYSYVVDNSNAAVQALDDGETLVDNAFTYTATNGTTTAETTLTITVLGTNDAPLAHADTNSAQEGSSNATGNVLQTIAHPGTPSGTFSDIADTDVDIEPLTVTAIVSNFVGGSATAVGNGVTINGHYGALTINPDGSYSYKANSDIDNAEDVQDIFTYTVTDGTATSQATLTITIADGTDPSVTQNAIIAVDEAGLETINATGSAAAANVETNTGTVTFQAGSDNITGVAFGSVAGITADVNGVSGADIIWSLNTPTQIIGKINGIAAIQIDLTPPSLPITADSSGSATVTVTLLDNFPHPIDANQNVINLTGVTVVGTDTDGDTAAAAVAINITDDIPTAHADSGNVTEGGLLTVAALSGVLSNDVAGADGDSIAGIRAAGNDTTTPVSGGVNTNITGVHGTLHLNADGSYTYQSNPNNISSNATDVFVYTIKDGDGDLSTTTLTINLADVTLVANNQTKTVDEAALDTSTAGSDLGHGTVTGSNPGSAAETVTGQLAVAGATSYTAQSLTTAHGLFQLNADGSYVYTLTSPFTKTPAANDGTATDGVENFGYTAFDAFGNTINGTITINITDDIPTAHADSGNVTEGGLLTVAALSGVLSNDVAGADGDSIAGIRAAGNDTTTPVSGGVNTNITGVHGTLHLNADGSYTYQSNPNNISSNATDVFVYTIKDGDGDLSTTTLTINLADVTLVANNQTKTVDEAALDTSTAGSDLGHGTVTGSNPGSAAETVTGQLAVAGATSYTAQSLTTAHGLFQLNADGSYVYTLTSPFTKTPAANDGTATDGVENFGYTAFDAFGNTINGTITINITDDIPTAHADSGNVTEGGLLTVAALSGVLSNDVAGADGDSIAGIRAAGNDTTTPVSGGVNTNITGVHGTLHLNADGSYTYQSNPNNISSNATDVFVYTIKDGDGDLSTTTLTINLADVTLVANNQTKTVDEAALDTSTAGSDLGHGTVTGSNPGSAAETVTGQLAVAGATSYTAQSLTTAHGLFQLNADGSYVYTLTSPVTETPANNGTDTINGVENFGYTAFDAFGNTINGTITINITDDIPTAHADSGNVTEGGLLTVAALSGVLSNDVAGADGDSIAGIRAAGNDTTTPVSGGVNTNITGVHGTLHLNADGSYTYQSNPNNISSNATDVFVYTIKDGDGDLSTTTLTINLADVTLVANNQTKTVDEAALDTSSTGSDLGHGTVTGSNPGSAAETVTGQLAVAGATSYTAQSLTTAHGLFQLNADGSYVYTLTSPFTKTPAANDGTATDGVESFGYTAFDAFGNTVNGTITINVADDVPTATAVSNSGQSNLPDTNLLITLDLSGSMDQSSGVTGLSKLDLAKQAILNLIQQYDSLGQVRVELVTFSDTAADASGGWVDLSDPAKKLALVNTILGLSTSGGTNYDAALAQNITVFNANGGDHRLTTPGVQNVAYFLSDGEPTEGDGNTSVLGNSVSPNNNLATADAGIQSTEEATWTQFANTNDIDSFALGMGSAATQSALNPIAFDGRGAGAGTNTPGVVVTNLSQLINTLVATVNASPVTGTLVDGGIGATFGADGGHFQSLVVNGTTYTLNGNSIVVSGTDHQSTPFDAINGVLTVNTNAGGKIALDLTGADVGHYTYTPSASSPATTEVFTYTVVDGDGDIAGSSLTITINPAPAPPANQALNGTVNADTLNGGQGDDILFGNGGADTLNGGAGSDILIGGAGADTMFGDTGNDVFIISTGNSPAALSGSGNNGIVSGYDVITDFSAAADKLSLQGTLVAVANTAGTNGTDSILTIGGQTVKSHAISNGIITFDDANTFASALSLTSAANVAAVVDYLHRNDLGNAGATVAFTATINSVNHTFIYEQVGNSPNSANDILVDLSGTAVSDLTSLISSNHVDPVILDLGAPGISLSSLNNGVSFDINGDGIKDQVAWTSSNDGILAYDVNGSGTIENGTEIFTPNFAGGNYASGLAALASLDSNADGVINSADTNFGKLLVWQDNNHNGIADPGEVSSLADHGITAISLDATPTDGSIDGQQLQAQGSFSNADGTTGTFVEAALDTAFGTTPDASTVTSSNPDPGQSVASVTDTSNPSASESNANASVIGTANDDIIVAAPGNILIGGSGNDNFVFKAATDSQPGNGHFDTITDFTHNSDHIDLTAIAGPTNVQGPVEAANTVAANSISWFVDNEHNETLLYVNTTAAANHVDMEIHLTGTNINLTGADILHHA